MYCTESEDIIAVDDNGRDEDGSNDDDNDDDDAIECRFRCSLKDDRGDFGKMILVHLADEHDAVLVMGVAVSSSFSQASAPTSGGIGLVWKLLVLLLPVNVDGADDGLRLLSFKMDGGDDRCLVGEHKGLCVVVVDDVGTAVESTILHDGDLYFWRIDRAAPIITLQSGSNV